MPHYRRPVASFLMGILDAQRQRVRERMTDSAERHLEPGEGLRESVYGTHTGRMLPFVAGFLVAAMALGIAGYQLPPGVIGVIAGIYVVSVMRYYYILVTDRRVVLVKIPTWSPKRAEFETSFPLGEISSAEVIQGLLTPTLEIRTTGGERRRFKVVRGWGNEAAGAARLLDPRAP